LQVQATPLWVERPRRDRHPGYRARIFGFSLVGRPRMGACTDVTHSNAV
jgi:hypothetical protein